MEKIAVRPILFLLFLSLPGFGQDSTLLSILTVKSDSERANQLYKRGFFLRNNDPQLAFQYAISCEKAARNSSSKRHLAKSYNLLGVLHYKKGEIRSALEYHKKALRFRKDCGDKQGEADSHTNMGNIYVDLKFYHKAESSYLCALELYGQTGHMKSRANCLINLGALNQNMDLQDVACEYYYEALELGEKMNDYEIKTLCLNNIAVAHYYNGDHEKAIAFNEDALKLRNLMDNNVEVADSYLNLAANYLKLGKYARTKELLDTAYRISRYYSYFEAAQEAAKLYASYFSEMKDYKNAFDWLNTYTHLKDSAAMATANLEHDYSVNEIGSSDFVIGTGEIGNYWLLISVSLFIIVIPYILFHYRR